MEAATDVPHEIEIRNCITSNRKSHVTHARSDRISIAWGKGLVPLMRIRIRVGGSWPVDPVTYYRAGTTSSVDIPMHGTNRGLRC